MIYIPKWIPKRYCVLLHILMFTFEKSNPQCKVKFLHAAGIYGIFLLSLSGTPRTFGTLQHEVASTLDQIHYD